MKPFRPRQPECTAIRMDSWGVDDVAISCDLYRLERMAADAWWSAAYRGDKRICIWLRWDKKLRRIVASVSEDDLGCVDDTPRKSEEAK